MADPMSPPPLKASRAAKATANPIRAIVDHLKVDPENKLSYIPLSIGDPTLDGNLLPPSNFIDKIAEVSKAHKHDGYPPAIGYVDARNAVASFYGPRYIRGGPKGSLPAPSAADVVLASGASHALEMVIQASLNPGDTLLLPAPCFSLYSVICANRGINVAHYCLDGAKQWAADLDSLERAMNPTVKAILINNPSNPCGSNFSKENLEGQLRFADKHNLLVIADEIYAGLVFDIRECDGAPRPTFVSVGALTDRVPCLIIGGIAKAYVVPGYRLGWVIRHDPRNLAADVWQGVQNVAALILGANSLMQAALNNLLNETPQSYSEGLRTTLRDHAKLCVDYLSHADGVAAVVPQGAMYILVRIAFDRFPPSSGITNDTQFAAALLRVKNVAVLPGSIFQAPGYIRLVFTKPADQLKDALARIVDFTKECTAAR